MSSAELVYLSRADVVSLMPPLATQVDLVERTYLAMATGRVELPPKPAVHPRADGFIHAMPSYLADEDLPALKWIGAFRSNKRRGLPYISGLIVINDGETGFPIGVIDAMEITAVRTAAASGVCVRRWAPPGWARAAIIGCGEQGRYHARVLNMLNSAVSIAAYDIHPERPGQLEGCVEPASDAQNAVAGADVIIAGVPIVKDPSPPIAPDWLGERWLALPIDFDASFQAESVAAAGLFLSDDVQQFEAYRGYGHFSGWPKPVASVGSGLEDGSTGERVLCCNLGVGALDAAFGRVVLDRALEEGIGTRLPL